MPAAEVVLPVTCVAKVEISFDLVRLFPCAFEVETSLSSGVGTTKLDRG